MEMLSSGSNWRLTLNFSLDARHLGIETSPLKVGTLKIALNPRRCERMTLCRSACCCLRGGVEDLTIQAQQQRHDQRPTNTDTIPDCFAKYVHSVLNWPAAWNVFVDRHLSCGGGEWVIRVLRLCRKLKWWQTKATISQALFWSIWDVFSSKSA